MGQKSKMASPSWIRKRMIVFHSRDGMARQVRQTDRRSPRITKGASTENNLEEDPRDADRDNAQVKNCEGDDQSKRL